MSSNIVWRWVVTAGFVFLYRSLTAAQSIPLCGQYQNQTTLSGLYRVFTNQWGADESGSQCVTFSEGSDLGVDIITTWKWSANASSVHAYPNIGIASSMLPLPLSNLSALDISGKWTYVAGSQAGEKVDEKGLKAANVSANVALDTFLDPDPDKATSTTLPKYEIMVWMGTYGNVKPIGYFEGGAQVTHKLGGTKFSLYEGPNGNGQQVYTWLAPKNKTSFDEDVSPLIHYLWRHNYIESSNYLGVVQFGTEALHSDGKEVTFSAKDVMMEIKTGSPRSDSQAAGRSAKTRWAVITSAACATVATLHLLL